MRFRWVPTTRDAVIPFVMGALALLLGFALAASAAHAEVKTKVIEYNDGYDLPDDVRDLGDKAVEAFENEG